MKNQTGVLDRIKVAATPTEVASLLAEAAAFCKISPATRRRIDKAASRRMKELSNNHHNKNKE